MTRFAFHEVSPKLFQAQLAVATELGDAPLIEPVLRDLIECRVSQINGCAYCVRMHSDSFAKHGGDPIKLAMLPVWQSADGFSAAERAALVWAECLTRAECQVTISKCHRMLLDHFEEAEISELTCIIATMNAWNRLGIAQHEFA
ncbi:carboxymuconolactone decarboxylase family protein [Thalassospira sp.]|uniref:carboxymuconolactone decarboxylase family protein n=1 Tax=Thalassospira sp. TaxID=1912094 RepID=UPI000C434DC8|nr:carboxymuconolactone decarboxylase family protein [Thalassospira sp.]MBC05106.1 alkylhydroperoxidase [Thalassospira sp.]|tara:strand:- start:4209 stop:4643 length:435 start_codon:yes stop_codon:yes gene_type:complete